MNRNVKILILVLAALTLSTAAAFAHQGVDHTILGTVKEVSQEHMVVTKKDAKEVRILLTRETKYTKAKAKADAKHSDLAVGSRVSIQVTEDGKTALSVKIGTTKASG